MGSNGTERYGVRGKYPLFYYKLGQCMLHVIRFSKSLKQNDLPPSAVRMVDALNTSGTPWEYVDIQFATSFIYTNAPTP